MFCADFDQDGWIDLFASNGHVYPQVDNAQVGTQYRQRYLIFRNLAGGRFVEVAAEGAPRAYRGAAIGDFDNDGDQDILMMDLDGGPVLLENRTQGKGNYLRVKAPVGSRITIESGSDRWIDEVRASGSYQSASEQVAHFGLGRIATLNKVTVRFPGGKTRALTDVKGHETLNVNEK